MKKIHTYILVAMLVLACLLTACSGNRGDINIADNQETLTATEPVTEPSRPVTSAELESPVPGMQAELAIQYNDEAAKAFPLTDEEVEELRVKSYKVLQVLYNLGSEDYDDTELDFVANSTNAEMTQWRRENGVLDVMTAEQTLDITICSETRVEVLAVVTAIDSEDGLTYSHFYNIGFDKINGKWFCIGYIEHYEDLADSIIITRDAFDGVITIDPVE